MATVEPHPPAPTPTASPPRRNFVPILSVALIVVAVVVGALLFFLLMSSDDGEDASTFLLKGKMEMGYGDVGTDDFGQCAGTGGYDDIHQGTSVTVYDDATKIIGTGNLGDSTNSADGGCTWYFQVEVPSGPRFYQVEIGHRGKITYTSEEAKAGGVAITLG
jgi:hypothetical protein